MRLLPLLLFLPAFSFAQNYMNVESVEYDASQNRWLAGNQSSIIARAADGELSFFGSATATHGLEIMGTTLFALDNNILRAYDLETETQIFAYGISGVSFLNGITNDGNGKLYITDFSAKKIYMVDVSDTYNITHEIIVDNTTSTPNGILYVAEPTPHLLFVNWGNTADIKSVDLSDNSVSTVVGTNLGNIDGIDEDAAGNIYISSWNPARISKYDPAFANPPETVSTPFISNPADIGYSQVTDTLAIPIGQNVVYVGLGVVSGVQDLTNLVYQLQVSPNPVSTESIVQFEIPTKGEIQLAVYNQQGQLVKTILEGSQPAGRHQVVLAGLNIAQGLFILSLQTNQKIESIPFIVAE